MGTRQPRLAGLLVIVVGLLGFVVTGPPRRLRTMVPIDVTSFP